MAFQLRHDYHVSGVRMFAPTCICISHINCATFATRLLSRGNNLPECWRWRHYSKSPSAGRGGIMSVLLMPFLLPCSSWRRYLQRHESSVCMASAQQVTASYVGQRIAACPSPQPESAEAARWERPGTDPSPCSGLSQRLMFAALHSPGIRYKFSYRRQ